jgi:myo-inositol-1(or 4)-monophosphatase
LSEFRTRSPGWGDAKAARDFVSFVDLESEWMIRTILDRALPGASFYGEETEKTLGQGYTWIVDPVDGTTNYLSGYDHWCVSIGLYRGSASGAASGAAPGMLEAGLILKPATDELFSAIRGGGAFRNGVSLETAVQLDPGQALIVTGTPFRSPDTVDSFHRAARRVMSLNRDIRRTGSAALDLAYVAAGFFQGFWEVDLAPYDAAAGLILITETGQSTKDFAGRPYDLFRSRGLVAGRKGVVEPLATIVREEYADVDLV